jgi:hypothetical protein
MAQNTEPERPAPAADADLLGEDASFDGRIEKPGLSQPERGSRGSAGSAEENARVRREGGKAESGSAPAGEDINQAGFLKDEDAGKP